MSSIISLGIGSDGIIPFVLTGLMVSDATSIIVGEGEPVLALEREIYYAGQRNYIKALERETYTHPQRKSIKSGSRENID